MPKPAKARQHLVGVEFQKPLLIRTWGVEDQVIEAEIDIGKDGFDMFVRIRRNDPTLGCPFDRQGIGEALHLQRIFGVHFLFRGEGESAPETRVSKCAFPVGVKGNLHLNHSINRASAAAGLGEARIHVRKKGVPV